MKLTELVSISEGFVHSFGPDKEVSSCVADTRRVVSGALFACMPSSNRDTHLLIEEAVGNGAAAVMVHNEVGDSLAKSLGIPGLAAGSLGAFREGLWRIAHSIAGHPSRKLKMFGVTGTNGKTTTAWILRQALGKLEGRAAYLGTIGFSNGAALREVGNTTPFPIDLVEYISEAVRNGSAAMAIEVSSHALEERRADGVEFDAASFTNLTQDHLDFHGSMEEYERSKRRLFFELPKQSTKQFRPAFNVDDPIGKSWWKEFSGDRVGFSILDPKTDLYAEPIEIKAGSTTFILHFTGAATRPFQTKLGGRFNASNVAAAAATLVAAGYSLDSIADALEGVLPAPGRFESIENDENLELIVDYAHTPDALVKLLGAVKELSPRRVLTVFGCGGDRDPIKRPLMAQAASSLSDFTIVTSDNPRTEDPEKIMEQVVKGIAPGRAFLAEADREKAIAMAVKMAEVGDAVVVAGKGHEDYQIIGRTKYPMDDRDLLKRGLELRKKGAN